MMKGHKDILIIAETKLDITFPKGKFLIEGFKIPCKLDVSSDRGGRLLVYFEDRIICKQLNKENISNEIQVIPIELNIRKNRNGCCC